MTKTYAGIGARDTPDVVLEQMRIIGHLLWQKGYTLRSGGAAGADTAFGQYLTGQREIFRPHHANAAAFNLAERFHPKWHKCSASSRALLARNGFQVLGADLESPSDFVVCWTKDGKASGGTGQALRIAAHYDIPIFNLHDQSAERRLWAHVDAALGASTS